MAEHDADDAIWEPTESIIPRYTVFYEERRLRWYQRLFVNPLRRLVGLPPFVRDAKVVGFTDHGEHEDG